MASDADDPPSAPPPVVDHRVRSVPGARYSTPQERRVKKVGPSTSRGPTFLLCDPSCADQCLRALESWCEPSVDREHRAGDRLSGPGERLVAGAHPPGP